MNVATHNGTVTMENPETGNHRTVRIKTQSADSKFAPGERIIGMLSGSDRYTNFGFVKSNGSIILWKKFKDTSFEMIARMIQNRSFFESNKGIVYHDAGCCRRCNRKLTTPISVQSGIGPYCAEQE
jgi:hypothetical protein